MRLSPDVNNYTLGKGILFFSRKNDDGTYDGERDLGNASDFMLASEVEKLEHYSSRSGVRSKDFEMVIEKKPKCSFTLEELTEENLALFMLGDYTAVSQTLAASQSITIEGVKQNRYYELGKRNVSNVAITGKVAGEDFSADAATGRVFVIPGGAITDDSNITVTFDAGAAAYSLINGMTQGSVEGFLRFVGNNSVGVNPELKIWRCSLTPSGDMGMIDEKMIRIKFEGEILADQTNHPDSPYYEAIVD